MPNQLARLKGIAIQQAGVRALFDKDIQKDLKLSDDQTAKIKTIGEDSQKKMGELFAPGADRSEMRTKMDELRKESEKQLMDVLDRRSEGRPGKAEGRQARHSRR